MIADDVAKGPFSDRKEKYIQMLYPEQVELSRDLCSVGKGILLFYYVDTR